MLITYNFYNSILLAKLINQFVKGGKKQKVEGVVYRFLSAFNRTHTFSAVWILLLVIELHKPSVTYRIARFKNKIVYKPKFKVTQSVLIGLGLKWIKEGVLGDKSHIKRKRYLKDLRKQARNLEKKVKQQGLLLTTTEQSILEKARSSEKIYKHSRRPFEPFFKEYFLTTYEDFKNSYGYQQLQEHNGRAMEHYLYHSYRW